jgi:hypothetical protein
VMQMLQKYAAAKAAVAQQQQQQPDPQVQGIDRHTCALTPLGTCSACPSNFRNVSSYYLDLFDKGGLLMDCGEFAKLPISNMTSCAFVCATNLFLAGPGCFRSAIHAQLGQWFSVQVACCR